MNLGTVGTGWITSSFIEAAQLSKEFKLVGVYSRTVEKAEILADTYNASEVFSDLEEMAKSEKIDVVYIASPNSVHFEQALLFLKNKKHVICEKPIFSNTGELEEAFKTAEANGVYLFEAIRNIHTPNFKTLKEKLPMAGEIRSAILPYIKYSSRYDLFLQGEEPNIFSSTYSGGALVDLGVYPLYLAVGLFGAPKKSTYIPVILRSGVDGSGTLVLEYEEFVCTILCSKLSHSTILCEIHGEEGTFVLEDAAPISQIEFYDSHSKDSKTLSVPLEEKNMVYECKNIAGIINTNNQKEYQELKRLSEIVLKITEASRKQNNIIFDSEK
ncbi:Gfo/Idh/MocA family oxidoreductase [Neobacillus sp. PS3-12]|uniref:Gfo/Idh/MocA family protein n=1 Tax=Neobacillus sp. PS3-12 TaxID=3070677 RepID=UPI0027DF0460|nr:Gfo/Idh/MocA family oxidoreductase [Neobacillus sp. PS3-12]WML55756.1 Gfo/Idh/MocA family oxidoreductase [Neobacillus sp. PS3-12]